MLLFIIKREEYQERELGKRRQVDTGAEQCFNCREKNRSRPADRLEQGAQGRPSAWGTGGRRRKEGAVSSRPATGVSDTRGSACPEFRTPSRTGWVLGHLKRPPQDSTGELYANISMNIDVRIPKRLLEDGIHSISKGLHTLARRDFPPGMQGHPTQS